MNDKNRIEFQRMLEMCNKGKIDLIITHHPAIFKKLKRVVDSDWQQDLLLTLAENGIATTAADFLADFFDSLCLQISNRIYH